MKKLEIRQWGAAACPLLIIAALAGCGGGDNNGGPSIGSTPTPSGTPSATPAGTPAGTPTPTPLPVTRTLTTISAQGSLTTTTGVGRFTQTQGTFQKLTGRVPAAGVQPTPTAEPTPAPGTASGGVLYTGTYTLSSGESGEFNLAVLPSNAASIVAVPSDFFRFAMTPTTSQTGTATISLQVSGTTGTGTIQLSNGERGTIAITGKTQGSTRFQVIQRRLAHGR